MGTSTGPNEPQPAILAEQHCLQDIHPIHHHTGLQIDCHLTYHSQSGIETRLPPQSPVVERCHTPHLVRI
eukprot:10913581-Prorocentrum_lima.AAC.1